tara:strand:- start:4738 stop:5244 length:507 start_codon:yes stop_codon:yes gene_type:complete
MRYFDLSIFKEARFGSDPPTAFQMPGDRDSPYPESYIPNDGKAYRITRFMNQGLPGETPDMSSSSGKYGRDDLPLKDVLEKPIVHPYSNQGDPDLPFGPDQEEGDKTQYGDSDYSQQFFEDDSPLSRRNELNRLNNNLKNKPHDRKPLTSRMNIVNMQNAVRNLTTSL